MAALAAVADNKKEWVVDSGTTTHLTVDKSILQDWEEDDTEISVAKAGSSIRAERCGSVEFEECFFNNVLYAPELRKNLLSVGAICDQGGQVISSKEKVSITKNGVEILCGYRSENGIYVVRNSALKASGASYSAEKANTSQWHEKLGHLSAKNIKRL